MNKTAAFIAFACLAAVGIIGAAFITIHRPDATATFTSLIVTILGLASTAAATFYALGKQGEKLEEIKKQTNGNLSRRDEEIAALRDENARLQAEAARREAGPQHRA
jgi:hypothetical protein